MIKAVDRGAEIKQKILFFKFQNARFTSRRFGTPSVEQLDVGEGKATFLAFANSLPLPAFVHLRHFYDVTNLKHKSTCLENKPEDLLSSPHDDNAFSETNTEKLQTPANLGTAFLS